MQRTERHCWDLIAYITLEDAQVNKPEMVSLMLLDAVFVLSGCMLQQNWHLSLLQTLLPVSVFKLDVVGEELFKVGDCL